MFQSPHLDGHTPAQNQSSTLHAPDMAVQLSAAHLEITTLRAQLAAKEQVITDQQKVIAGLRQQVADGETFRMNVLKERTYLRRGDIDPTTKLTQCIAAWELGITFGNDNAERPAKYRTVTADTIASQVGASKSVVMSRIAAMSTPAEGFTPVFERQYIARRNKENGMPYKVTQLAPPEGKNWLDTWGADPATMIAPPTPARQAKNTEYQRAKTAENRAAVAEARRILAKCPSCGSLNVSLLCQDCGCKTPAAECLPAPDCLTAESARRENSPAEPTLAADSDVYSNGTLTKREGSTLTYSPLQRESTQEDGADSAPPVPESDSEARAEPPDCLRAESAVRQDDRPCTAAAVLHLVGGDREIAPLLARATSTLYAAVADYPNHVVMQRRVDDKSNKYLTVSAPLTPLLIAQHLVGTVTLGAGLLTSDEDAGEARSCRAVAYDSDRGFAGLVAAGRKLAAQGLSPLLVRNEAKRHSGHLWLFFDRDVDPAQVFASLETWAPGLARVQERFPAPSVRGGHRLRLPGGCYLPVGMDPVPVQVALCPEEGEPQWEDALSPLAWVLIAGAMIPADAVQHVWIAPGSRGHAAPPPGPKRSQPPAPKPAGADTTIDDAVARFNADYSLSNLVDIDRAGMFHSPWHPDTTPSCKAYSDGHWVDFSRDNRGGDALSLYCARHGHWPESADKPERIKVLRSLGYLPEERKDGIQFTVRGDDLLVALRSKDQDKWLRAKNAFRAAFPRARYAAEDKAWTLPASEQPAVVAWARAFAATERGGVS